MLKAIILLGLLTISYALAGGDGDLVTDDEPRNSTNNVTEVNIESDPIPAEIGQLRALTVGGVPAGKLEELKPKIVKTIDWLKALLNKAEMFPMPGYAIHNRTNPANTWDLEVWKPSILGMSNIVITSIKSLPKQQSIAVEVKIPYISLKSQYKLGGRMQGLFVSGEGKLSINVSSTTGSATIKLAGNKNDIYVDDVNVNYSLGKVQFSAENLKVKGIFSFIVNFLAPWGIKYQAWQVRPELTKTVSNFLKKVANMYIKVTNALDLPKQIKNFISNHSPKLW